MADLRLLALTHLLAAGAGFAMAPRELLETEVVHKGFFETDTKRVLAAAVESLRSENKLLVYSYNTIMLIDAKGGMSHVTHANLFQSNGVIHVTDAVSIPR